MAKEKIYTIPVTDSYKETDDCPICYMYNKLIRDKIDFLMDTAYMEDDIRSETNRLGFCKEHYEMLNKEDNRLGIALIMETHMKKVHQELLKKVKSTNPIKKGLLSKKESSMSQVSAYIQETSKSCYICETVEITFDLYLDTLIYLYKKDPEFKKLFEETDFYCMKHFGMLYDLGNEKLKGNEKDQFITTLTDVYTKSTDQILSDLDWFIKKFDYRYKDEPWNDAKTAIKKALKHSSGINC